MRLLIVNPNTSAGVTNRIRSAAEACAAESDHFVTTCSAFGPELIVDTQDAELAAQGVLETVRTYAEPVDGIILASFGDTGAREVRALRPSVPVVGIASAAFLSIRALETPFGIVTFGEGLVPGLRAKAEELGVGSRLVGVVAATGQDFGDPGMVQERYFDQIAVLCRQMETQGARAIVLGGGPLAGMATRLVGAAAVPVIDGTQAAINIMRTMSDCGPRRSSLNSEDTETDLSSRR
ncbi:MAG: aspartate/glutamate racemase family protein [Pseudomonadota bacterium]